MMHYRIVQAAIDDAEEILRLQKIAYQSEAERYNDYSIVPLRQTLAEMRDQFRTHIFLKAVSDNRIIGTVRAYEENGACYVARLAVLPDMQHQRIGTVLMNEIEKLYNPKRYELFVGSKSDDNIRLYQRLGYTIYEKDKYECGDIDIFYMEKPKRGCK
jgi:ribosomal protein S18 acetylase RimI-like enzyme